MTFVKPCSISSITREIPCAFPVSQHPLFSGISFSPFVIKRLFLLKSKDFATKDCLCGLFTMAKSPGHYWLVLSLDLYVTPLDLSSLT